MALELRAYAELARISNLPTCVSNVLVGCALGQANANEPFDWLTAIVVSLGVGCFYVGGMVLNDVADREIDRDERPDRPIPSGRVPVSTAIGLAVLCFLIGWVLIATRGGQAAGLALVLVMAIVAYDLLHKRLEGSTFLMGVCRGLVYLVAAAAVGWPPPASPVRWLALLLALYTIGITLVARKETEESIGSRGWIAIALPLLILAAVLRVRPESWLVPAAAAAVVVGWLGIAARRVLRRPPQTIKAILTWISGMCLVDAFFLSLLGRPGVAGVAVVCFAVTVWGHRHVLGT